MGCHEVTPNMKVVHDYVKGQYGRAIGVRNCRPIAGSSTWSQHSWSNANDIYVGDKALGDEIVNNLYDKFGEYVRYILWWRAGHYDHIHVDMWPYGYATPLCAGGSLRVKHKNGIVNNTFSSNVEDLIEGVYNMAAIQVIDVQIALNKAGLLGANGKPLVEDDIYGPNTAFALANGFSAGVDLAYPLAEAAHERLDNLANI